MIRPATVADVPKFAAIINDAAEHGLMLHRSLEALYERVRNFQVAEEAGEVIGVCGLRVMWADLAEIYALAVSPEARGRGLGRQLVEACVEDARRLGIRRLMSLTYERGFFERLKFEVVDRQNLPLKVWTECIYCSKKHACDEIAMVRTLTDIEPASAPAPPKPAQTEYVVPVTLNVSKPTLKKMNEQPPPVR